MLRLPPYPHPSDPALVVVSVDPGGTCGWAVHKAGREALEVGGFTFARQGHLTFAVGQIKDRSEDYMTDEIVALVREAWCECNFDNGDELALVVESFKLRMFSQEESLLSPVRVGAKIDYAMRHSGVPVFKQTPADAMRAVTDERLKTWNLYTGNSNMEHARDAQRHGILFLRKWASDPKIREQVSRATINT